MVITQFSTVLLYTVGRRVVLLTVPAGEIPQASLILPLILGTLDGCPAKAALNLAAVGADHPVEILQATSTAYRTGGALGADPFSALGVLSKRWAHEGQGGDECAGSDQCGLSAGLCI